MQLTNEQVSEVRAKLCGIVKDSHAPVVPDTGTARAEGMRLVGRMERINKLAKEAVTLIDEAAGATWRPGVGE